MMQNNMSDKLFCVMYKWVVIKQLITTQTLNVSVSVSFFHAKCAHIQTTNSTAFVYDKIESVPSIYQNKQKSS